MRVLITGGSGFIAAWLIARLQRRDILVTVFDIKPEPGLVAALAASDPGVDSRPDPGKVRWMIYVLSFHKAHNI